MSSKISKRNRVQRGETKRLEDLPVEIQEIIEKIRKVGNFGKIGIFGSYRKGNWAEDSDLDIAVNNYSTYKAVIDNIAKFHNIKIDGRELKQTKFYLLV